MSECIQCQIAVPDAAVGKQIAEALVRERLAACVQSIGPVGSTYRWEGKVETASERLLLVKTTEARRAAVIDRVRALHPYTVPEIIVLPIRGGLDDYLRWIADASR